MKLRNLILSGLVFCSVSTALFSQTYFFDNYNVRDGLAQSNVFSIIQTKEGFLWVGTGSGASLFDGKNFQNFTSQDGMADNGVRMIYQDKKGNIWFGHTGGGISRWNGVKMSKLKLQTTDSSFDISSFAEDANGQLWIGTVGAGVFRISNPTAPLNQVKYEKLSSKTQFNLVFGISILSDNSILLNTEVGIKIIKPGKSTFDAFRPEGLPQYFQITCIYEDSQKNIWFGSFNGGLYKLDNKTGKVTIFDSKRDNFALNWITCLTEDKSGDIWAGTWGGGISKFAQNGDIETFNNLNGLPDLKIRCLATDRENNLLIGTNETGLFIFKGKQFVSISTKDGLINDQVWAICQENNGNLWFGTNEGITVYNAKTGYKYFNTKNSTIGAVQIRTIKKDRSGNLWIGTADNAVWECRAGTNLFRYNNVINAWFPNSNYIVTAMEIDKDNNLWVGTTDGLIYYEIDQVKVARLSQINGLQGTDISALYCDSKGNMWVGSRGKGLSVLQGNSFKIINIGGSYTPTSICEDKTGKIWIGTEGQGVIALENEKIINRFGAKDGLLADFITLVTTDNKGDIYIGTNRGLNKYDPEKKRIITYSQRSGFIGIEVKNNAFYKDSEGNMWFGTVKGAIKDNVLFERFNQLEPATTIRRFRVNLKDRNMEEGLKLNYQEKSITFDYSSVSLTNPDGVMYKVMLEGAEKDWRPITKETMVTYSPLPPGKYVFKVIACNNEGIWNKNPVTYAFKINPPFWLTWWFFTILGLVILTSIVSFIKIRERNLIIEKRILEEKVKERTAEVVRQKEEIEKEKEKSEGLLLNTLPVKVVNDLKVFGKTEPESFEQVTVFFSDVAGFTTMSSTLEPAFLISQLNEIFTAFDDIMVKHNCERIKTIGDAYMAVCGMPERNEAHAENITNAAIEILEYLHKRNSENELKWKIRVGINSGKVVGGIVGVRKYIYDIFGDTVNTASRMESNGEPMKINCSENTYHILKEKFSFIARESKEIKGKGEMKMFFVDI